MSQKQRRPTVIEMHQRSYQLESQRSMKRELIKNEQGSPQKVLKHHLNKSDAFESSEQRKKMDERQLNKRRRLQKNRNKQIFDGDFHVQQMSNPVRYLINYSQTANSNANINRSYNQNMGYNQNNNANNMNYNPPNPFLNPNRAINQNLNPNFLNGDPAVASCQNCCGSIALCLGSIFSCCCTKCCVYELSTSSAGLVETFGRFRRLLKPGFNRINPCSEEVFQVDMKIRLLSTGRNVTMTRDNVKLTIETSVAFRVVNPVLVYYVLGSELNKAVLDLAIYSFRRVIGENDIQSVLTKKQQLTSQIIRQMNKNGLQGIHIENVFFEDVLLPPDIQRDLSSLARTKRITQANLIETKADVQSAELMRETSQLLDTKAAMQIRYLELVQLIGKSGSTLVMDIGAHKGQKSSY